MTTDKAKLILIGILVLLAFLWFKRDEPSRFFDPRPTAKSLDFNLQRTLHFMDTSARAGSRVVLFPETNLTGYYFPHVLDMPSGAI